MKLKLSRGYKKYNNILAKIENADVDVYVRKNVPPAFRTHKSQSYEIRNLSSIWARKSTATGSGHLHERLFVFFDFLKNGFKKFVFLSSVMGY